MTEILILVWREEACTPTDIYTYNPQDPFDGIEILGIRKTQNDAMALIDQYHADHPNWKFHIEPITDTVR